MGLKSYDDVFDDGGMFTDDTPREAAPVTRAPAGKGNKDKADPLKKVRAASRDNRALIAAIKGIVAVVGGLIAIGVIAYVLYWGYTVAFT